MGMTRVVTMTAPEARRVRGRSRRSGCSSSQYDAREGTIEAAAARTSTSGRFGSRSAAKTMTGQCHRYQEYEMSPTKTMGRTDSARETPTV